VRELHEGAVLHSLDKVVTEVCKKEDSSNLTLKVISSFEKYFGEIAEKLLKTMNNYKSNNREVDPFGFQFYDLLSLYRDVLELLEKLKNNYL
jgi:CRISPR/Cas system-associated endonuclease Cas3-HD